MTSHGQPETRCWTCGRRTIAKSGLCRACRRRDKQAHEAIALTGGRWVLRGGIRVWVELAAQATPPDQLRQANAAYAAGDRSTGVVAGYREYQRERKRKQRAGAA